MRSPAHWRREPDRPGLVARLLSPLGALYAAGTAWRLRRGRTHRPGVPVICVGNLTAGGTGKTPTVIALVERLAAAGRRPGVVSRGHGGALAGPVAVEPGVHTAGEVGDEPLLIAAFCPVWIAKDRAAGARAAEAAGCDVILLDDGFQNPSVAKDLALVVVDAETGFGNGRTIPAGPLREPIAAGLARADLVLSIGPPEAQESFSSLWGDQIAPAVATAELVPLPTGMDWAGLRALAFAGIGRPEKFFATLSGLGAVIVRRVALADHQALAGPLMARLQREALTHGLQLVTTEKDAVRLPPDMRSNVLTLPVRLQITAGADILDAALDRIIGRRDA